MNNGISIWNGYPVHGDIKELDRMAKNARDYLDRNNNKDNNI